MSQFDFCLVVEGVSIDDDAAASVLSEKFDAVLSWHRGTHRLAVTGDGADALDAFHDLFCRLSLELPALRITRLDPDLVGAADIAARVDRSRQNVQQWVDGQRNAGTPFPAPEGVAGRSPVWRWAEVNAWLRAMSLSDGEVQPTREESLRIDLDLLRWAAERPCRNQSAGAGVVPSEPA